MYFSKKGILTTLLLVVYAQIINAEPDPNFHCYLLFGQSNMAGGCGGSTDAAGRQSLTADDCDSTSRIKVMGFTNCNQTSNPCQSLTVNRQQDEWYTAFPPLNNCGEGIGPGDNFSKTLLDSIREDVSIGLIPWSFPGQDIGLFEKNNTSFTAPTWAHPSAGKDVYKIMVERCKKAQEIGVIKGILFHQGENNAGGGDGWVAKVVGIFNNLVNDLSLDENIPFIAGELLHGGCCSQLNPYVNKIPSQIPNGGVASAAGLKMRPGDQHNAHFDCDGMKEFGVRYAKEFLKLADQEWVPRIGTTQVKWQPSGALTVQQVIQRNEMVKIFSLDGKKVLSVQSRNISSAKDMLQNGKIYLLKWQTTGRCNTMVGF